MIEVELPDGTIAEFPDGTSQDVIKGALQKRFGAPESQQSQDMRQELSGMSNMLGDAQIESLPQARYDALSPGGKAMAVARGAGRMADDFVRGTADMLTFGLADEFAAKAGDLTGIGGEAGNYEQNLADQRQRDSEGGVPRFAGQMAGAVMMPGAAAKTTVGAMRQGALMGGAYGFGSGEGGALERAKSMGGGAIVGGAAGAAVRGAANAIERRLAGKVIPSAEELGRYASAAYRAADDAGVIIKPQSTQRLTAAIKNDLAEFGYDPGLQSGISVVLNRLDNLQDQNVTLKGMDIIRRLAREAGNSAGDNGSQRALSKKIIDKIDDFISDLKPADVLAGNAKEAGNHMFRARSIWTRMKKAETLDNALTKAERRAASTGSGGNADNAMRQNVRALLDNPRTSRGMSAAERKAAERVVRGTPVQNTLRLAGKLSPAGNGLMAGLGVGGAMVNPAYGIPSLVGLGAKAAADRMTVRNVEKLSQLIRSGGLTTKQVAEFIRQGVIPAPVGFQAIEAAAQAGQMPMSRIASEVATGR